jgi:Holliday junction resolvase RusA-like endonuclease
MLEIELDMIPIPWKRPGQWKDKRYDMQKKEKEVVGYFLQQGMKSHKPFKTPIYVVLEFYMPQPESLDKKDFWSFHSHRPDIDNLSKFILDAANTICWEDDCFISVLLATKVYSTKPGVYIKIEEIGNVKSKADRRRYPDQNRLAQEKEED